MSNISTFGTYTMARLGIYASHKALDITGNNISNIYTKGYTRQTIDQISLNMGGADRYHSLYDTRVGSGAFVVGITQARDRYLDMRYRAEQTNVGYMSARVDGLNQIASVLDEVGKGLDGEGVMEARFQELIQMMQTFNTQGAGKDDFDTLFRSAASQLVDTFHSYASQLNDLHENLANELRDEVDQINSILTRIQELNVDIRKTHIYGGNALELQDERNLLLDELSQYIDIDVSTEREYLGERLYVDKLVVKTGDVPPRTLIDGIYATQLSIRQVPLVDKDGNYIDEKGNRLDEGADPIMVDDPNFNIDLGKLTNPLGKVLEETVSQEGPLALKKTGAELIPFDDNGKTVYFSPGNKNDVTRFQTEEDAQFALEALKELAEALDDPDNPKYQEPGYDFYIENIGAPDAEKWVVRYGPPDSDPDYGTKSTYLSAEVEYTYAPGGEGDATAFSERAEADAVAAQMTADAENPTVDENGRLVYTEYQVIKSYVEREEEDNEGNIVTVKDPVYTIYENKVFKGEVQLGDTELYGSLQARREILTKEGVYSTKDEIKADGEASIKRGLPFYQKTLDVLANTFANLLNEANREMGGDSRPLFSNSGIGDEEDPPINASNISISYSWATGSLRVEPTSAANRESQSTMNDNLTRMLGILTGDLQFVPGGPNGAINTDAASTDVFFTGTFNELLTDFLAGGLATDMNVSNTMLNNYEIMSDDLYVERDGVMGVDLNDEAMNMMMYEKSYTAACRLMTTYDSMLDKLINGTAV